MNILAEFRGLLIDTGWPADDAHNMSADTLVYWVERLTGSVAETLHAALDVHPRSHAAYLFTTTFAAPIAHAREANAYARR